MKSSRETAEPGVEFDNPPFLYEIRQRMQAFAREHQRFQPTLCACPSRGAQDRPLRYGMIKTYQI